ncbi:hypothetical protein ACSNOI_20285 [Actinomadura kijaniata]|uniref:hypothetical protein n=1 Tax=Actinomadura kijaniata TaxID=46161 RepID=UPI003F1C6915
MRRTLTTLSLGAAAAASLALATPANAAAPTAPTAPTAATAQVAAKPGPWSKWKHWTLQPGVGGVEVKGKSRWRKQNGAKQAEIVVNVRDTDLKNSKNACAKGIKFYKPVGNRSFSACGGKSWKTVTIREWGLDKVDLWECVDNAWSFEKCSKSKTVYDG